jgi:hypothetical protein
MHSKFALNLIVVALCCATIVSSQRIYIRHKRSSLERENVPAKESTVVFQSPNDQSTNPAARDLPKDFENEIAATETDNKDCKDFLEFDYNPLNDSLFFNGRLPSLFGPQGAPGGHGQGHGLLNRNQHLNSFEQMFHQMLTQASQMFNRFPMDVAPSFHNHNYPDNYNGTEEEIVTIGGQQFRKKQHIINKTSGGSKISIMSTVYEPVNASGSNSTTLTPDGSGSESATVLDDLTDGKIISYK